MNRASEENILLPSGILYSGNTMKIANLLFFSHTLHLRTQETIIFPAINFVYKQCCESILEHVQNLLLDLIGDRRCESPEFNARYGTYSLMNVPNIVPKVCTLAFME